MKITMYACLNDGVPRIIGEYESIEDIEPIEIGMWSPGTVISLEVEYDKETDNGCEMCDIHDCCSKHSKD